MSRIGGIFTARSLRITRWQIVQRARGEYERLNLAAYLFLFRKFRGNRRVFEKVRLSREKIGEIAALKLRPLPGEEEAFEKFSSGIQKYADERLASFFIWRRSRKERVRKVPYHRVSQFNRENRQDGAILIPLDSAYGKADPDAMASGHLSLCLWVPHEEREDRIEIDPKFYPAREDWSRRHELYLEWTERHSLPCPKAPSPSDPIIGEILRELGPDFEEEIERTKAVLRSKLREEFSPRYCLLLEMLASNLQELTPLSAEEKLRALSISVF